MTELTDFSYANNSPTTLPQSRFIAKVGSYFRIPQRMMREATDMKYLKDTALVKFNVPDVSISEEFYVSDVRLNVNDLLTPSRFHKSKLYQAYTTMIAGIGREDATFVVYNSGIFVICDLDSLGIRNEGVGGVFMNYPPDFANKIMLPIESFLKLRYPLPSL